MRLLFGMILGAALTVGGAYISDTAKSGPDARPMVNWKVVGENVDSAHRDDQAGLGQADGVGVP